MKETTKTREYNKKITTATIWHLKLFTIVTLNIYVFVKKFTDE